MTKLISTLLGIALLGSQLLLVAGASLERSSFAASAPYPLVSAVMIGEVNGVPFNLTGHAEAVLAQLKDKHPEVDFATRSSITSNGTNAATPDLSLRAASDGKIRPPLCIPMGTRPWKNVCRYSAFAARDRLRNIQGRVLLDPRQCMMITCYNDVRVFLCNDNNHRIDPQTNYLASFVTEGCAYCEQTPFWSPCDIWCGSQFFERAGFNVIFRRQEPGDPRC